MKYIIFRKQMKSMQHETPVVFPNALVHLMVAEAMVAKGAPLEGYMPVRAGEYAPLTGECSGESTTLRMRSDPQLDAQLITMGDYGVGYT